MERIQKLYVFVVGHAPGPQESDGEPLLPRDLAYPHHYTEILHPRKAVLPANGYVHPGLFKKKTPGFFISQPPLPEKRGFPPPRGAAPRCVKKKPPGFFFKATHNPKKAKKTRGFFFVHDAVH